MLSAIPLFFLAAGGWWLCGRALRPLETLTQSVGRIHAANLAERIPLGGAGDELDQLTAVFNDMTARLDASFERVREFTLHASHELKTPLAILRADFGELVDEPGRSEADRARFASHLDEIERLARIVDSLTLLTKADARLLTLALTDMRLDDLLREAAEDARALGEARRLRVTCGAAPVTIRGDRHRLRQLLLILCDNAVKYNCDDGGIALTLTAEATLRENGALLSAEVALHDEALKRLDAQVKAGESPAFELTQARLALNRSKLARHDVEKIDATARAQLAAAIGVPSTALSAMHFDFADFRGLPAVPGASVRRRALTHRADLLAALADYAATEAEVRLQVARQYPDVKLGPGYQLDQTENKWSLGFAIELPILNQNRGPIAQAEAKRKTAAAKFEARQAAVFGEIEIALAAYRAARAKADTAATLAEEAARASDTTQRMVDAGELAPLEHTRRRIEASAAKLSRFEARLQAQQAIGALEASLQVPLRSVK